MCGSTEVGYPQTGLILRSISWQPSFERIAETLPYTKTPGETYAPPRHEFRDRRLRISVTWALVWALVNSVRFLIR